MVGDDVAPRGGYFVLACGDKEEAKGAGMTAVAG